MFSVAFAPKNNGAKFHRNLTKVSKFNDIFHLFGWLREKKDTQLFYFGPRVKNLDFHENLGIPYVFFLYFFFHKFEGQGEHFGGLGADILAIWETLLIREALGSIWAHLGRLGFCG